MVDEHCQWIDTNVQIDDSRAKCGEIHVLFRVGDLAQAKQSGDLRAIETIDGLPGLFSTVSLFPSLTLCVCVRARARMSIISA